MKSLHSDRKSGEIDAVTNADFEPLALKLLEPFEDFRRWTHAAINFYEINHEKPPFRSEVRRDRCRDECGFRTARAKAPGAVRRFSQVDARGDKFLRDQS